MSDSVFLELSPVLVVEVVVVTIVVPVIVFVAVVAAAVDVVLVANFITSGPSSLDGCTDLAIRATPSCRLVCVFDHFIHFLGMAWPVLPYNNYNSSYK